MNAHTAKWASYSPEHARQEEDRLCRAYAEEEAKRKLEMKRKSLNAPWMKTDNKTLFEMRANGASYAEISAVLNRSEEAISKQYSRLQRDGYIPSEPKNSLGADQLIEALQGRGWVAGPTIAHRVTISQSQVSKLLLRMAESGMVERRGSRSRSEWRLTKAAAQEGEE